MWFKRVLPCVIALAFIATTHAQTGRYLTGDQTKSQLHLRDAATDQELKAIQVGPLPVEIAVSPNGRIALVANEDSLYSSVVDLDAGVEIARLPGQNRHLVISRDGTQAVGVSDGFRAVNLYDLAHFTTQRFALPPAPTGSQIPLLVGGKVYIDTLGTLVGSPGSLQRMDTTTGALTAVPNTSGLGTCNELAATPDEQFLVTCRIVGTAPNVVVVDTTTDQIANSIPVPTAGGPGPRGLTAVATSLPGAANTFIYALVQGSTTSTVHVIDYKAGSPTFGTIVSAVTLPAGSNTANRIVASGDGNFAFVSKAGATGSIFVVDLAAALTNPPAAVLRSVSVPGLVAIGAPRDPQTTLAAPVVSTVSPRFVTNAAPTTLTITGDNFLPGAMVRIGKGDLLPATNITPISLTVSVPTRQPAGKADLLVINPNTASPVSDQWQAGALASAVQVANPPTFQPRFEAYVSNLQASTVTGLNTGASGQILLPTSPSVTGMAVSKDGSTLWLNRFNARPVGADVIDLSAQSLETGLDLDSTFFGGNTITSLTSAIHPVTGKPVIYFNNLQVDANFNANHVILIADADPTSPTFKQVIGQHAVLGDGPLGLAATPDGKFIYSADFNGNVVIYDVVRDSAVVLPGSSIGLPDPQFNLEVSPDGKLLIAAIGDANNSAFGVALLDITNPTIPKLVASLFPKAASGSLLFVNDAHIFGNKLFGYDTISKIAFAYTIDVAANSFIQIAAQPYGKVFAVGGFGAASALTPDGTAFYVPDPDNDSVVVIDTATLAANSGDPVVGVLATGIEPFVVAFRPGVATAVGANVSVSPSVGVTTTFAQVTKAGSTTAGAANSNPLPLPAGLALGTPGVFYNVSTTATSTGAIKVCLPFGNQTFSTPTSALRLMHGENGAWVDRTTSVDTANQVVCGTVTSLSPFAVMARTAAADFSIAPGTTAVTVNAGAPATFTLNFGSVNTFTGPVTLTCSDPAAQSTCSFNPASVNIAGANTTAVLTVTTTARTSAAAAAKTTAVTRTAHLGLAPFVTFGLVGFVLLGGAANRKRGAAMLGMMVAVLALGTMVACGGGGGGNNNNPPPPPPPPVTTGTPAGAYTINVTATSGSLTHTSSVTVNVN
jgi:YVTN family beta-propeller protein